MREWKKIFHANRNNRAEIGVLISNRADFKTKSITKDKRHYIIIKGSILKEDIIFVNIYAPNTGATKY